VELVDTTDLKSVARKSVRVQIPPEAHTKIFYLPHQEAEINTKTAKINIEMQKSTPKTQKSTFGCGNLHPKYKNQHNSADPTTFWNLKYGEFSISPLYICI
tara:strand:+ start:257 stop:559 length:303 start_codon:yes stop_codon:yes gene_type:complete